MVLNNYVNHQLQATDFQITVSLTCITHTPHTFTHPHVHIHHIHTPHTYIHTYICMSHIHTHTHKHTLTNTHTLTHTHTHTHTTHTSPVYSYHFLVYNASVQLWLMCRPFQRPGHCRLFAKALQSVVRALEECKEKDHAWRLELMM